MASSFGFSRQSETTMNWHKILTFDKLERPVKQHVKRVYSTLAISLLSAAAGAYIHLNVLQVGLLTLIGSLGCLAGIAFTPHQHKNQTKRLAFMVGFALCTGMSLGPLLEIAIYINPSIIPTALFGTFLIFACFSLSALLSDDRKWLYLGGFLMSGISWMMMMSLFAILFGSRMLFQVELYFGMAVMCGFVLYDTQMIVEKRRRGDDDFIWHSIDLFVDMVQIFRRLIIILGQKEEKKNKRS